MRLLRLGITIGGLLITICAANFEYEDYTNPYGCDQLVAEPYYANYFQSPGNYPRNYKNEQDVCWILIGYNSTLQVNLTTTHSDVESLQYVECTWADYVEVRDGDTPTSPLLDLWCGSTIPPPFNASSSFLFVRFRTDHSVNEGGFRMRYYSFIPGLWDNVTDPEAVAHTGSGGEDSTTTPSSFVPWFANPNPVPNLAASTSGNSENTGLNAGIIAAICVGVIAFVILVVTSAVQLRSGYISMKRKRLALLGGKERSYSSCSSLRSRTPGRTSRGTILVRTNAANVRVADLNTMDDRKSPRPKTSSSGSRRRLGSMISVRSGSSGRSGRSSRSGRSNRSGRRPGSSGPVQRPRSGHRRLGVLSAVPPVESSVDRRDRFNQSQGSLRNLREEDAEMNYSPKNSMLLLRNRKVGPAPESAPERTDGQVLDPQLTLDVTSLPQDKPTPGQSRSPQYLPSSAQADTISILSGRSISSRHIVPDLGSKAWELSSLADDDVASVASSRTGRVVRFADDEVPVHRARREATILEVTPITPPPETPAPVDSDDDEPTESVDTFLSRVSYA